MTSPGPVMMSLPVLVVSCPAWASPKKFLEVSLIIALIAPFSVLQAVKAFHCKFPNEGCDVNNGHECCSGKCVDLHPGTNARCTRLSLHKPCLYTYQCDDRLRCGSNNTCCAKYWGTCTRAEDCCDPDHRCFEIDGFYYKRCLYPSQTAAIIHAPSPLPVGSLPRWQQLSAVVLVTVSICVNFALNRQLNSLWRTLVFL